MKKAKIDYCVAIEEVRDRIVSTLEEMGVTQNSVANGDAPAQKRLNNQLSHGSALTVDSLLRVMMACPGVSPEWLLRGEGDKYKTDIPQEGDTDEVADLRAELTRVHAERDELKQICEQLKAEAREWRESAEYHRIIEQLKVEAADLRARLDEQRNTTRILVEAMGKQPQQTTATKVSPRIVKAKVGGKQVEVPVFTLGEAIPSGVVAKAKAKKNIG